MKDLRTPYYKALERAIKNNARFCVDGGDIKMREARDTLRSINLEPAKQNDNPDIAAPSIHPVRVS